MADNLNVQIGIDTSKVNADIAVLKAKLKEATVEMHKLGQEAAKTGDESKLKVAAQNVDALTKSLIANQRVLAAQRAELRGVGVAAAGAARGLHEVAAAGREIERAGTSREVFTLSKDLGKMEISSLGVAKAFRELPAVAIPVAVIGGAALAMNKVADEAAKSVRLVEDLHDATGMPTRDIIALRKLFIDVNGEAKHADEWIRRMSEGFTKAHENAAGLEAALSGISTGRGGQPGVSGGVQVMRGSAVSMAGVLPPSPPSGFAPSGPLVIRGGQPLQLNVEGGLGGLVDRSQFALTTKGQNQFTEQALKILENIEKTNHMRALRVAGTEMPGVPPETALTELLARATTARMEHAGEPPPAIGEAPELRPGAAQMATGLQIAQKQAAQAGEDLTTQGGLGVMTGVTKALQGTTSGLDATTKKMQETGDVWDRITKDMTENWDELKVDAQLGIDPGLSTENWQNAWTGAIDAVKSAWSAAVSFVASNPLPAPGGQAGQVIPLAQASGGMIPGSGTGDTVPAMLTPGEFVNRRASVDYYGTGLFSALNNRMLPRDLFSRMGFAVGGLVGDRLHFADGGMVGTTSGGGTPVHLHLDGQQFVMSASDHVASALVTASQRYQMRSAGVKPSWYGGRPGA
jgi:hypothetical protein